LKIALVKVEQKPSHDHEMMVNPAGDASILNRQPVGPGVEILPTTLTLSEILGIAIGGSIGIFCILSSIFLLAVRRKHRKDRIRHVE
jgi:hypothetical protein